MGADRDLGRAGGQGAQLARRGPSPCRGRSAGRRSRPWAASGSARVSKCCRARISVGAIRALWPPPAATSAMASMATTVLPEPTSPWTRRLIRSPACEVAADLRQGADLGAGQLEGQVGLDAVSQRAARRSGRAGILAALGLALGHGQLVRQQFVIGQAALVRGAQRQVTPPSLRRVEPSQRLAPGGQGLAGQPGRVLPLRQLRRRGSSASSTNLRTVNAAAGRLWRRIDGLDLRDLVRPCRPARIMVGMGDLQGQAEAFDLAGDHDALGADGVLGRSQLAAEAAEEDQVECAGAVIGLDLPGLLRAARLSGRRRSPPRRSVVSPSWASTTEGVPPVDQGMGLEEQHVANFRGPASLSSKPAPHARPPPSGSPVGA